LVARGKLLDANGGDARQVVVAVTGLADGAIASDDDIGPERRSSAKVPVGCRTEACDGPIGVNCNLASDSSQGRKENDEREIAHSEARGNGVAVEEARERRS
jgi:hypothetical protein